MRDSEIDKIILTLVVIEPLVLNRENVKRAIKLRLVENLSNLLSNRQELYSYKKEKIYLE